jgi:hypothetical protein
MDVGLRRVPAAPVPDPGGQHPPLPLRSHPRTLPSKSPPPSCLSPLFIPTYCSSARSKVSIHLLCRIPSWFFSDCLVPTSKVLIVFWLVVAFQTIIVSVLMKAWCNINFLFAPRGRSDEFLPKKGYAHLIWERAAQGSHYTEQLSHASRINSGRVSAWFPTKKRERRDLRSTLTNELTQNIYVLSPIQISDDFSHPTEAKTLPKIWDCTDPCLQFR